MSVQFGSVSFECDPQIINLRIRILCAHEKEIGYYPAGGPGSKTTDLLEVIFFFMLDILSQTHCGTTAGCRPLTFNCP